MINIQNISPIYQGLLIRNRAFASYKKDELEKIFSDLSRDIPITTPILDPMSGYGGGMAYFGKQGYRTVNSELNPPAYYWQVLINPTNTAKIVTIIDSLLQHEKMLPQFKEVFSLSDNFFTEEALYHIDNLHKFIYSFSEEDPELSLALLLPFVARFANYLKSSTNITHFKEGGLCMYGGWETDLIIYLNCIKDRLLTDFKEYKEIRHRNILSDIMALNLGDMYSCFVTSPPYPNYRDYSKLFKIENQVLNRLAGTEYNFRRMIGSNNVSGKEYGKIISLSANRFLNEFSAKSQQLKAKAKRDVEVYYFPYFAQYFYNIQEAYLKLDQNISPGGVGYIVVNDNIARDIVVPVGASISDIFQSIGYQTQYIDIKQISHYGNIGKAAKRINSRHTRYILKVCKP